VSRFFDFDFQVRMTAQKGKGKVSVGMQKRLGLTANSAGGSGATNGLSSTVAISARTGMVFEEMRADSTGLMTPARLLAPQLQQANKYFGGQTSFKRPAPQ
jgi:hypothetical protein